MDIREQRNKFLDILLARQTASGERIFIEDVMLKENELDGRTFWGIVCPALQREGVLKYYDDPDVVSSDFVQFCMKTSPEYRLKSSRWWELRSFEGIEERLAERVILHGEMREIEAGLRKSFKHRFIVDVERLSDLPEGKNVQHKRIVFDEIRTIIFKEKRHIFHTGDGKHGRPLKFFLLLWPNRSESGGGRKRSGERQDAAWYAQRLGLQSDRSLYSQSRGSKAVIADLIKGLNRTFRDKKIPAKVDSNGGILLEVNNP